MTNTSPTSPGSLSVQSWIWFLGLAILFSAFIATQRSPQALDTPTATSSGNVSISYSDLCDGSIDAVNGHAPAGERISINHRLDVLGWLALSTIAGTVPAHKLLLLKGEAGDWIFREAQTVDRPDVGSHFGNSGLSAAGVKSTLDVSGLHGKYELSLAYRENNLFVVCRRFSVPLNLKREYAPTVPTELELSGQAPALCDGNIDSINNFPPATSLSTSGNLLKLSGWLVVNAPGEVLPDLTYVVLKSSSGTVLYAETIPKGRPDVVQHFNNLSLANSGYEVTVDLSSLKGEYVIGLAYRMNDETRICGEFAIPLSVGVPISPQ